MFSWSSLSCPHEYINPLMSLINRQLSTLMCYWRVGLLWRPGWLNYWHTPYLTVLFSTPGQSSVSKTPPSTMVAQCGTRVMKENHHQVWGGTSSPICLGVPRETVGAIRTLTSDFLLCMTATNITSLQPCMQTCHAYLGLGQTDTEHLITFF